MDLKRIKLESIISNLNRELEKYKTELRNLENEELDEILKIESVTKVDQVDKIIYISEFDERLYKFRKNGWFIQFQIL